VVAGQAAPQPPEGMPAMTPIDVDRAGEKTMHRDETLIQPVAGSAATPADREVAANAEASGGSGCRVSAASRPHASVAWLLVVALACRVVYRRTRTRAGARQ
jgi:hypothetical protein